MADCGKVESVNLSNTDESSISESSEAVYRMRTMQDVMEKTLNTYCAKLRLTRSIPNVNHSVTKQWQKETISQLKNNIKLELEDIYSDENIEELLNKLDKITAEVVTNSDQLAWRPSGNPRLDSHAHLAVMKREKLKVLQEKLTELESYNSLLQTQVQKHTMELEKSTETITALEEQFDKIIIMNFGMPMED